MSQFVVVVFSDKASADTGSLCLKKLGTEGMTIYRSVVLSKNLEGQISMSDRVEEKSYTTIVAALIGGLAGLPAGLEAAAAGTAGGALFGLSAEFTNRGASSQFVDKASRELARSKFAIVAEIASEGLASFEGSMRELGGTITHPIGH